MYVVDGAGAQIQPIAPPQGVAKFARKIHAPAWWHRGRTGAGIKVAVIDTGADLTHPFLRDRIMAAASFVPGEQVQDGHGHGTHVCGIVAQVAPGASLIVAKGLSDAGHGEDPWLAAAIRWCVAQGARIINASWGGTEEPTDGILRAAVQEAVAAGVLFVASAGNNGNLQLDVNTMGYPARWAEPLAVAATWQLVGGRDYSAPVSFSSAGEEIDVAAPGTWVISCAPGGGWVDMSGTSMAAPVVSGAASLIMEDLALRGMEVTEPGVVTLLQFLTRDIGPAGRDRLSGVGELDLEPHVERRIITLTEGGAQIDVQNSNSLVRSAVAVDVPAKLESGRFLIEFRGAMTAAGAHAIGWNGTARQGQVVIDVIPTGGIEEFDPQ